MLPELSFLMKTAPSLTKTETTTLKKFLLQEYDPGSGILGYDWYNAMITALNYFEWECGAIQSTEVGFDISDRNSIKNSGVRQR